MTETEQQHSEEIEISFRLDEDGRTTSSTEAAHTTTTIHYEPRSISAYFEDAALDDLLLDCEIADSGLMPRTFWIGANDTPECSLEQMALNVFHHHVGTASLDPSIAVAGAEWWVQIRPSPDKVGRYAMQGLTEENGITFHWDKDEDLRILCGGSTYIHPHLSTVTYLTGLGAPTLVTNSRIHTLSGEWMLPSENPIAWISWPRRGKHFSFDGRYLHAAPMELMPKGLWEKQLQNPGPESKSSVRQHRRVTFLVNIWLHYKPFNVNRFPMAEKMSGYENTKKTCLTFGTLDNVRVVADATMDSTRFTWPMGGGSDDCDEAIHMDFPVTAVHEKIDDGGSLQLCYKDHKSVLLEKIQKDNITDGEAEQVSPSSKRTKTDAGVVDKDN